MNEEDIFDSFPGIGNVIASNVVRAVSYLHSRAIVHRDIKLANVLVSNSRYSGLSITRLSITRTSLNSKDSPGTMKIS